MCLKWIMIQLIRMVRTVKLSYTTVPQAIEVITQWRKAQSVVIRTAYNRVREGKKDKEILALLRAMPQGRLDSWFVTARNGSWWGVGNVDEIVRGGGQRSPARF